MKIIKPQSLGLLTRVFEDRRQPHLVVTAAAFVEMGDIPRLGSEVSMWKLAAAALGPSTPLDLGLPKTRGEVLVTGKAFQRGGVARGVCSVRVQLGPVDKTLYVVGNRRWKFGAPTEPEPFTSLDVSYANAFGGEGYAENPGGKGAAPVRTEAGEVHWLPNVEDPKRLLQSPRERPALPSGFGAYDITWHQRHSLLGTYDKRWLEERYPGFAEDFDPGYFNAAPTDQRLEGYFEGDERVMVENMHAEAPVLEGRLPGLVARIFLVFARSPNVLSEVVMRVDTVHVFPNEKRIIVLYRGVQKIASDDASDVTHLLGGFEQKGEPKERALYEAAFAARTDRKRAHLFAMRDQDLLPAGVLTLREVDEEAAVASSDALRRRIRQRVANELEKSRETLRAEGLDPSAHGLGPEVGADRESEVAKSLATMSFDEVIEKAEEDAREQRRAAEVALDRALADARRACAEQGVDFDEKRAENEKNAGGPPKFSAEAELAKLREQKEVADRAGVVLPVVEAQLADAALPSKLRRVERELRDAYRRFAHHLPRASSLRADEVSALRASIEQDHAAGESFSDRDLTGAELGGIDLSGAKLAGAMLECAGLDGARLTGADFAGAVLVRATLRKADLRGANLRGANLGAADLEGAILEGANLEGAILVGARLVDAVLVGATLDRADIGKASFEGSRWSRASARHLRFAESSLADACFDGTDLRGCIFLGGALDCADFSGANLSESAMLGVNGDKACFRGATLENFRAVDGCSFVDADFVGAVLERAQLRDAKLGGADLTCANLRGADLSGADLGGAKLDRAVAVGAMLVKADLRRASLTDADLMDAILQHATLAGANLEGANLFRADLMRVRVDGATITRDANLKKIRFLEARRGDDES